MKKIKALFLFKRDLRIEDNSAFYHALKESDLVAPVYVFDKDEINSFNKDSKKVVFIWNTVNKLKESLKNLNSDLIVKVGNPIFELINLAKKFEVDVIYTNEDYEPNLIKRNSLLKEELEKNNIILKMYKDYIIFDKKEILNTKKEPYVVFTQYKNAWLKKIKENDLLPYTEINFYNKLTKFKANDIPSLESLGFEPLKTNFKYGAEGAKELFNRFSQKTLKSYSLLRNTPNIAGVSYLSAHIRYGTISIRSLLREAFSIMNNSLGDKKDNVMNWIEALIWREFYYQLLFNYPNLIKEPLQEKYKYFKWENNLKNFQKWCEGKTGFPIIDAAMNQLNKTGYMHNRLRMVVSSFLIKDLLINYRLGEMYFAHKLIDYDLALNNGNWQWSASVGCDTSQYIRLFNPIKQSEKFDNECLFIKKYLPIFKNVPSKYIHEPWRYENELKEYGIILGVDYPKPIINHEESRKKTILRYSELEQI